MTTGAGRGPGAAPPVPAGTAPRHPEPPGRPGILRPADGRASVVPRRFAPSPALAPFVVNVWSVAWDLPPGEEVRQDVLTHPGANMTVEGDRATITGVTTGRFVRVLTGTGRVLGVRFTAAGVSTLVDGPPGRLTDATVPVAELLGPDAHDALVAAAAPPDLAAAADAVMALVERWHHPLAPAGAFVDEVVAAIVDDHEITRVDQVARRFGVGVRTLQRRFEHYLGVGPKWVIQRRRLHDVLGEIECGRREPWGVLAARLGFADQAHFVNAFTELVGRPPSDYEGNGTADV